MPKGSLVKQLLQAYGQKDHKKVKKIAMKIAEDERKKSHHRLADSLDGIINSFPDRDAEEQGGQGYFSRLPRDKKSGADLVSILNPRYYLEDVVLSEPNKAIIQRLLHEYYAANQLRAYNLDSRRKLLFCGPPGCGKTMTAHALASELGLPLLYVHMDSLVSSYLGDTASNLRKIFGYAEKGKWVIFFDEFDTVGKSRDDKHEHGELKRAVNTFLQMLDNVDIKTLLIAASNHQHLLDRAAWRRFEEILYFDMPDSEQIEELILKHLRPFKKEISDLSAIAREMSEFSHARVEQACQDAIREAILTQDGVVDSEMLHKSAQEEKRRKSIYDGVN